MTGPRPCRWCGGPVELVHRFTAAPAGETAFAFPTYEREVWRCLRCAHVENRHEMDLAGLYEAGYRAATYGDQLAATYDRIMALPPERSDNRGRVARVDAWAAELGLAGRRLLDVGAGLAVFPAAMRAAGWTCTALDPDPVAVAHARDRAGVDAVCGDFLTVEVEGRFDLVTFNKVLEHVLEPEAMLRRAAALLAPGGAVYVELPDGEGALDVGPEREELYVEHHDAYSAGSVALLAAAAGFRVVRLDRLVEPSTKFTLAAVLRPARG